MGLLFDYFMTGDWEKAKRIQLYKKLGNKAEAETEKIEESEDE